MSRTRNTFAIAFFFWSLAISAVAEDYRSFVSHRNVNHDGKAYSVFEIRPCPVQNGIPNNILAISENALNYRRPLGWELDGNAAWASELLKGAYDFALARYTRGGFFTPETGQALEADLKTLFSNRRTVLLVTDTTDQQGGAVPKIHFMVSVHVDGDGGLPLENRLLGHGLENALPRSEAIHYRSFPDTERAFIGPVQWTKERMDTYPRVERKARKWATQGIAELKTLVSNEDRTEDFLPLLHQLLIENVRWTRHAQPRKDPAHRDIVNAWLEGGEEEAAYLIAPDVVPYTRTEKIWIEAPNDALAAMYVKRLKFDPALPKHRFPDPHVPGSFVSLLSMDPAKFETEAWESIVQRPGGKMVQSGFLSYVFPKENGNAHSSFRFLSPVEVAVNWRLSRVSPFLKDIGRRRDCMKSFVHLGNGDINKGWRRYRSHLALPQ